MAFTAGSVELARANKLGAQLAHYFNLYGNTGMAGETGAVVIEKLARKLNFGITGLTTGKGFPPFGSIGGFTGARRGLAAALQNPEGLTQPNGITVSVSPFLSTMAGLTVGIYARKFITSGPAPSGITAGTYPLSRPLGYTTGVAGLTR